MVRSEKKRRLRWAAALLTCGSLFQLSSCDPTVRSTILAGLETTTTSLTNTIINAFFLSLDDEVGGTGTGGTSLTTT